MMPERIWLQIGGDPEDEDDEIYMPEVTWSWEKVYDYDPEYIRADIHEAAILKEREACAQIAQQVVDKYVHMMDDADWGDYYRCHRAADAAKEIVDAIDARREEDPTAGR